MGHQVTAPKPHPFVVTDSDGAALGIDWQTAIETGLIETEGMSK